MNKKLIRTAKEMLSIANDLDDLGLYALSSQLDRRAMRIISAQVPDAGVENLVSPNLLSPEKAKEIQEEQEDNQEKVKTLVDQDEEAVLDQEDFLKEHQDEVETPLREIVK
jgi:hypothetical protein